MSPLISCEGNELKIAMKEITHIRVCIGWNFPGGPVVKTPCFHHEGLVSDQETEIPQAARQGQKKSMHWLSLRRKTGVRRGTRKLSSTFYVLKNISEIWQ